MILSGHSDFVLLAFDCRARRIIAVLRNPVRRESSLETTRSGTGKRLRIILNYTPANAAIGNAYLLVSIV